MHHQAILHAHPPGGEDGATGENDRVDVVKSPVGHALEEPLPFPSAVGPRLEIAHQPLAGKLPPEPRDQDQRPGDERKDFPEREQKFEGEDEVDETAEALDDAVDDARPSELVVPKRRRDDELFLTPNANGEGCF